MPTGWQPGSGPSARRRLPSALRWTILWSLFLEALENSFCFSTARRQRYRVQTALMKRVAAPKPFQAQPDSAAGSVYFDRFAHILRAGRIEPAGGGQQRGDQAFVPGEGQDEEFAHLIKRRRTSA